MKSKALLWYAAGLVCFVIALIIFLKSVDWKTLVVLALGMAAVLLVRQGVAESRKK